MSLEMWKGNRLPVLTDSITSNNAVVNLTGSTVTFSMRNATSAALKVSAASVSIDSAVTGAISYAWAATDTDTVGSYLAWWTVSSSGKSQDTPEFGLDVVEHAPASLRTHNPVASDGATVIYRGDGYQAADGRALTYQVAAMDAPDLTGLTVVWRVATASLSVTGTVVGEDAVTVELTSTQTLTLAAGSYSLELEGTSGANKITLLRTTLTVLADLT